ncbi:MAG: SGNH/GDSL hydrolase family protein, partial [bacterium]|nr:SGNH/GDSL hydrolase family protein [bacterium]
MGRRSSARNKPQSPAPPEPAWPFRKKLLFGAVTTIGFFLLLELTLFLFGVEPVLYAEDPYVGFASNSRVFARQAEPDGKTYLATAPNKIQWFNRQRFPEKKERGTYRIFSLGGSTTYGRPYNDTASFSGWLREFLKVADPSRDWEVVNAGGISYASYRVAIVMEELLGYEPDLFIIYSGHNEFLERRTYEGLLEAPRAVTALGELASRTRTYAAVGNLLSTVLGRRPVGDKTKPVLDIASGDYKPVSELTLPEGAIDLAANVPRRSTALLAPAANLVVRESFHPALVDLL